MWRDWRWQMAHRVRTAAELSRFLTLSEAERDGLALKKRGLPVAITPYYLHLLDALDPGQPLRRTMVPVRDEALHSCGEAADPLHEGSHALAPGLIQRYPDRALFLVTDRCAANCRYCTRSRMVGRGAAGERPEKIRARWERAIACIESRPQIRDVLLSGGDPLTLEDDALAWLLTRLRRIPHLEVLRIGTKTPMVLPMRITGALARMLRKFHPLWMSIHCTHPSELTDESTRALGRLADAGIPLGSQTVLLKGVNDDIGTMKQLFHGLMQRRVRPYYLYQCDPIPGSAQFRTSVADGLALMEQLRGHTSGYAVPTFVIDAPGGGGKIPLLPTTVLGTSPQGLVLRNYEGRAFVYPDHSLAGTVPNPGTAGADPFFTLETPETATEH
ncbi:lysine 2,3-aminomutase [Megalodesulfovibrio paquesii]